MRLILIGFFVVMVMGFTTASWGDCNEGDLQAHIVLLRTAAVALASSRPDLATALNSYADIKTKCLQMAGTSNSVDVETQKVQEIATQFGNAILSKDRDTLEGFIYTDPSAAFSGNRMQGWQIIRDYHDRNKEHELLSFNITKIKFSDDMTEAGVIVKELFSAKDGGTHEVTEGWTFRNNNPQNQWLFVGIAFGNRDREH